jgi:Tetratricopeptide repeat
VRAGGAGKTSVAVEYAHRHLAEVGVAWQFPAEDRSVLAAGFRDLAAQLGVLGMADTREPVDSVHGVLAAYPQQWLLLFDNAPDRASVEAFLPPGGQGLVLITSRNQIWPPGHALDVPVLGLEVAAEFLLSRTGDPDREATREIAGELGGLPLALEQAAAYIQASADSLAGYLASFRQRSADLLARGEPAGYSQTVATTWQLAFENLQQTAPRAIGLLRLLANCAPEAIPLPLLLQSRPGLGDLLEDEVAPVLTLLLEDRLAASDAIAALRRYSLITSAGGGSVSVHRLVQAVTIDQMPEQLAAAWAQAAAALIEAALPDDPQQPGTWPLYALLLPHAQAALAADSAGIGSIAAYLGDSGSYAAARDLWQKVAKARERVLGAEHPETLAARVGLASCTGRAGDVGEARDQYTALLPVLERVLGAEHPQTLAARANLAAWVGEAGDVAGARDQLAALVPVLEQVLGAEHPETLAVRPRLAAWTGWAGDAAGGPRPVRRAGAGAGAGPGRRAPGNLVHPRRPRRLDRAGGRCGGGPRPAHRAATYRGTSPGPRAPANPDRPGPSCPLDGRGRGGGQGPRPVRRPTAHPQAAARPRAPRNPGCSGRTHLLDRRSGWWRQPRREVAPACCLLADIPGCPADLIQPACRGVVSLSLAGPGSDYVRWDDTAGAWVLAGVATPGTAPWCYPQGPKKRTFWVPEG